MARYALMQVTHAGMSIIGADYPSHSCAKGILRLAHILVTGLTDETDHNSNNFDSVLAEQCRGAVPGLVGMALP